MWHVCAVVYIDACSSHSDVLIVLYLTVCHDRWFTRSVCAYTRASARTCGCAGEAVDIGQMYYSTCMIYRKVP